VVVYITCEGVAMVTALKNQEVGFFSTNHSTALRLKIEEVGFFPTNQYCHMLG
jgi:hypothetical protein